MSNSIAIVSSMRNHDANNDREYPGAPLHWPFCQDFVSEDGGGLGTGKIRTSLALLALGA